MFTSPRLHEMRRPRWACHWYALCWHCGGVEGHVPAVVMLIATSVRKCTHNYEVEYGSWWSMELYGTPERICGSTRYGWLESALPIDHPLASARGGKAKPHQNPMLCLGLKVLRLSSPRSVQIDCIQDTIVLSLRSELNLHLIRNH